MIRIEWLHPACRMLPVGNISEHGGAQTQHRSAVALRMNIKSDAK
jgi:hypothetical protein